MNRNIIFNVLWASLLPFCHAKTHLALVNQHQHLEAVSRNGKFTADQRKNLLNIRGGAGPFDPLTLAKTATVAGLAQGILENVAPALTNDVYGTKSSPLNDYIMKQLGAGTMSFGVLSYCLLFQNSSLEVAAQISRLPWILTALGLILNKEASAVGFDASGPMIVLAENVFMLWAVTQEWGMSALKVYSVIFGAMGVLMTVQPKMGAKLWGKSDIDGTAATLVRMFGFYLLASNGLVSAMVHFGKDAVTAVGYGWASWLGLCLTTIFITKDIPLGPLYPWLVFDAVVVGTIVF